MLVNRCRFHQHLPPVMHHMHSVGASISLFSPLYYKYKCTRSENEDIIRERVREKKDKQLCE